MNKYKIVSDIHVEFNGPFELEKDSTYLIAGDVGPIGKALDFLNGVDESIKIFYIAGNHEFYGYDFPFGYATLREGLRNKPNVTFLQDEYVEDDGVYIFGSTMWNDLDTPFFSKEQLIQRGANYMNDFRVIKRDGRRFTPQDMIESNSMSRVYLQKFLDTFRYEKTIVMTHHLPSFKSVDPMYGNESSQMNHFFASKLDKLMENYSPNVWIHGHTHTNCDYHIGETQVMCRPYGYPNENQRFKVGEVEL